MKLAAFAFMMVAMIFSQTARAELIVLAAPRTADPYYAGVADKIFEFHIKFARKIEAHDDDVLILTDKGSYKRYVKALDAKRVLRVPMLDIWMRDFGTLNTVAPVMFRYTPEGQGGGRRGQRDADAVQEELAAFAQKAGLSFKETDLLNDGGNFVDDYAGNAVLSRKFLRDNKLSEKTARQKLRTLTGVKNIAFIEADEQGGLEHADGVVSFVGPNTLIINSYPSDPAYARKLKRDLQRGLPGVKIHEIVTPYDGSKIHDARFGSACGLYTNALVTPKHIYFPQFGIPQDALALKQVRAATRKKVIPIDASGICSMGGGVRCMSWQLRGKHAANMRQGCVYDVIKNFSARQYNTGGMLTLYDIVENPISDKRLDPDYLWGDWSLAQQFDFTGHFQNTGHTGVFPGILKKSCGIKGQAKKNLSS